MPMRSGVHCAVWSDLSGCDRPASLPIDAARVQDAPMRIAQSHSIWRWTVMQRFRVTMILGTMALAFSGCLSPAPSDGAQRGAPHEIDEAQRTASIDETASTASAPFAVEVAEPAYGPLELGA